MPIYEFICARCGKKEEKLFKKIDAAPQAPVCGHCNFIMTQAVARPGRDIFPSDGLTLEHVERTPRHFKSYTEMKQYAKKRNLELGAIL